MVMHSVGMGYIVLKKSLWLYFKPKTEYAETYIIVQVRER